MSVAYQASGMKFQKMLITNQLAREDPPFQMSVMWRAPGIQWTKTLVKNQLTKEESQSQRNNKSVMCAATAIKSQRPEPLPLLVPGIQLLEMMAGNGLTKEDWEILPCYKGVRLSVITSQRVAVANCLGVKSLYPGGGHQTTADEEQVNTALR